MGSTVDCPRHCSSSFGKLVCCPLEATHSSSFLFCSEVPGSAGHVQDIGPPAQSCAAAQVSLLLYSDTCGNVCTDVHVYTVLCTFTCRIRVCMYAYTYMYVYTMCMCVWEGCMCVRKHVHVCDSTSRHGVVGMGGWKFASSSTNYFENVHM